MAKIAFIGFRGSGKSTLGRWLATELGLPFVDTDDEVLASMGYSSVSEAWKAKGEQAWRDAEFHVIPALLKRDAIFALGGGAPMIPLVAKALSTCDIVFNLTADEDETAHRIALGDDRPALTSDDAEVRLSRLPAYAMLGTFGVDTSGNIDDCKLRILDFIENGRTTAQGGYAPHQG
jgi:shikimate kinase